MKHTPGPWEIDYIDGNGQIVIRGKDYEIATCWHHCVGSIEKEMYANANLMIAAPELFESLEELLKEAIDEHYESTDPDGLLKKARTAIAKAKGKQT